MEHPVYQPAPRQLGEEALDGDSAREHDVGSEVEGPARMPGEPGAAPSACCVRRVVVEDHVDQPYAGRHFPPPRAFRKRMNSWCRCRCMLLPDHRPVQHVQRREQRGRPVALVVVGHGRPPGRASAAAPGCVRSSARICDSSRPPTARPRAPADRNVEADHRRCSFSANAGSFDSLKLAPAVRPQAVRRARSSRTDDAAMPIALYQVSLIMTHAPICAGRWT